jgi:hypothetical protein
MRTVAETCRLALKTAEYRIAAIHPREAGSVLARRLAGQSGTFEWPIVPGNERPLPRTIRIRDLLHDQTHELGPDEPALRVPYDFFHPEGPAVRRDDVIEYGQKGSVQTGRVAETILGETKPGERVLVRVDPAAAEGEWWLCEIEALDGVEAAE